ncbi:MAG: WYL domain-containing protein [Propionibacteriaceae bacterium]|jgi:proteasome accessory factor B|nr:WYL domain-containing protein [Propionibacteriaceae bacterium]
MADRTTERLLNLTIALLTARGWVTKRELRESVDGYQGKNEAAFEMQFERDKRALLDLGVPVETNSKTAGQLAEEDGYRISRTDFELPPISFTPAEAQAVALAGAVWEDAAMSRETQLALTKLHSAGVELDVERSRALAPQVSSPEPAFQPLAKATAERREVTFKYNSMTRHFQPWALAQRGSWYVSGYDLDRKDKRLFKLSRISSEVKLVGKSGAYERGEADIDAQLARFANQRGERAVLAIAKGRAPALRRRGKALENAVPDGFEAFEVEGVSAQDVGAYGPDVIVLEPDSLREDVIAHLEAAARRGDGQL